MATTPSIYFFYSFYSIREFLFAFSFYMPFSFYSSTTGSQSKHMTEKSVQKFPET